ncbi:Histone deacetylase 6 [Gracilariopsis chorda]|uniref:Histone deacetylase 6 n=1 Tax=Gracilariopsis chorda TaxID=448386 RepID=A0A2V3J0F8_9FLOR|nr:Histone deacetylase 6 [Gracilariopsis chorda]|eukprot:PXF47881.1 Histone deacetylase 6 [Gracilariopsis chorda]
MIPSPQASGKAPRENRYWKYKTCEACGDVDEGWVCLVCCFSGCSRYKKGHMVEHAEDTDRETEHPVIAISLSDLSVWCFLCDEYVTHPKLEEPFREFHRGKFGKYPSGRLHDVSLDDPKFVVECLPKESSTK